jgi:hypothetical protein
LRSTLNGRQHFNLSERDFLELDRLRDEATQLLAITIASRKTARPLPMAHCSLLIAHGSWLIAHRTLHSALRT